MWSPAPLDRRGVVQLALGAGYLLAIGAAVQIIERYFSNPMTSTMGAAVAVGFVAGHLGLESKEQGGPTLRRALRGAALGLVPVLAATLVGLLLGGRLAPVPGGASVGAIFGVAQAAAGAYKAEVWLHGLPLLFARRARLAPIWGVVFAVVAGVAAAAGAWRGGFTPGGVTLTLVSGVALSLLWLRADNPWVPVAAHGVWLWCLEGLFTGDLWSLELATGRLSTGLGAAGAPAWAAALGFAAVAAVALLRPSLLGSPATVPAPPSDDGETPP
ncbi:MAG: hypothetical protein R3B72_34715 [Polyangiaceae bacterium]